jgi:hypothetical protein
VRSLSLAPASVGNSGTFRAGKGHVCDLTHPDDSGPQGFIYNWIDKRLQEWGTEGKPARPLTVNLQVDGKTMTSVVLKDINRSPLTTDPAGA